MKVSIINFSNRKNGNSQMIMKLLSELYVDEKVKAYNFSSMHISQCGKCSYECMKENEKCPYKDKIYEIYKNIISSDICYYIVANYCDYPCSNFFIFNERGCGYFNKNEKKLTKYLNVKKKFIVITNSNTKNFLDIFKYHVNDEPDVLFISPKKFGLSSISDNVLSNPSAKYLISDFTQDIYRNEVSAMGIVMLEDKILATKEDIYGNVAFSLPKGHVEKDETYIETAIREVEEETSFKLTKEDYVKSLEPYEVKFIDHNYHLVKKLIYPIIFKVNNMQDLVIKEKRVKEISFYNVYEFIQNCTYDNLKYIVLDALKIQKKEQVYE